MDLLTLPMKNNGLDVLANKPSDAVSIRSARSGRSMGSMRKNPKDDKGRVPHPSHRHASPSAPWPWVDLDDEVDREQLNNPAPPIPPICPHDEDTCGECWKGYPQSRFPNWTVRQVKKSKIWDAIHDYSKDTPCVCHQLWVDHEGCFHNLVPITAKHGDEVNTWKTLVEDKQGKELVGSRVRALFIENISGPMLQMLGAKFNIEPFFWSSSLNWIPSRFQEEVQPGIGDHITITLTFVRSMSNHDAALLGHAFGKSTDTLRPPGTLLGTQKIDPHSPLMLHSNNRLLVLDLLAVHLIRNVKGSTIISFHPTLDLPATTASFLHERIRFAGQSVYWQSMFQKHNDPTFVLLTFVWHAMYAWDEALENLYEHICNLESRVITTEDMPLTQELHVLRAHHLHYSSLLDDYSKHVIFIRDTHNPAMDSPEFKEDREAAKKIMARECANLLTEITRLKGELHMQERRLKNVMDLVFSSVNINDSRYMRVMTEAAVRDSADETGRLFDDGFPPRIVRRSKQRPHLILIIVRFTIHSVTVIQGVFGMNVSEINPGTLGTISVYLAIALPLTVITTWIIVAFQSTYIFPENTGFMTRLGWPVMLMMKMIEKRNERRTPESEYSFSVQSKEDLKGK